MTDDSRSTCQQVRDLREGALPYWRNLQGAITRERAFLDGQRYERDLGNYNLDRRNVQFRGQQISNTGRLQTAQATAAPRSIEALPVDRFTDPDDAEIAVSVLEWETGQPWKGFDDTLEAVIQDCMDARVGCAMLDFDPEYGTMGGECFVRWVDPNLVMFTERHLDPHMPGVWWFQEVRRMRLADVQAMGKLKGKARWNVKGLVADASAYSYAHPDAISIQDCAERLGVPGESVDHDHIWMLFCWYKDMRDTYKRIADEQEIPADERYMGCDNPECSYRSDTQGMLKEAGKIEGELPSDMDPCPICGAHMTRRDIRSTEEDVLVYPKGRKLVIQPLLQQLADDEPCYEDAWPIASARSFPVLWISRYVKGGRPMSDSDTTRNWDAQVASDQMLTMAFGRVTRHQTYYGIPSRGITVPGAGNKRYEMRDDDHNIFIVDQSDADRPTPAIQVVQGASLDPAWGQTWDRIQQVLTGFSGTNDFGLTPQSSKQIAAATVQQLDQIGNIPVEHFIRRKNRALSKFYGVYWDYVRATYSARRLARLKIGDEFIVNRLRGDDLPNFDFMVTESPPFSGLEKARTDAFGAMLQIIPQAQSVGMAPDVLMDIFAKVHRLPPSIVRDFKRAFAAQRQQAEAQMQQQAAMGGPEIPPELMDFEPEPDVFERLQGRSASPSPPAAIAA